MLVELLTLGAVVPLAPAALRLGLGLLFEPLVHLTGVEPIVLRVTVRVLPDGDELPARVHRLEHVVDHHVLGNVGQLRVFLVELGPRRHVHEHHVEVFVQYDEAQEPVVALVDELPAIEDITPVGCRSGYVVHHLP